MAVKTKDQRPGGNPALKSWSYRGGGCRRALWAKTLLPTETLGLMEEVLRRFKVFQ